MKIHITIDKFWDDCSSIERWPEILLRLPKKMVAKSKYDLAKKYLFYPTDDKGRVLRSDEFYGLFGSEDKNGKITISGCNLIKKDEVGYFLSKEALNLRDCYEKNENWEKELATQLLKYSIRVRAVVLGILNSKGICFPKKFLNKNREAYVEIEGVKYFILNPTPTVVNLNDFMKEFGKQSLGPYWKEILNINDEENIELLGTTKEEPSLANIGTYLKIPLILFEYLEWFIDMGEGQYVIDREKMKEDVGEDVFASLMMYHLMKDTDILRNIIEEYQDIRGFFPVELVGETLKSQIAPQNKESIGKWIDHYFMEGINIGKFKLIDWEQGQPRHGRGLLGDKGKQLIKLEF